MKLDDFLTEATVKEVGIIFGRFNPPHKGHKAAWEIASQSPVWFIGTNKSTVGPKDPLPFDVKIQAMIAVWPEAEKHIVAEQSWFTLASKVYKEYGETTLVCITDEDWVTQSIQKYNGQEGNHGLYKFKEIIQRPSPRLSSATALRDAVVKGDKKAFAQAAGVPAELEVAGKPFFDLVAEYLLPYQKKSESVTEVADSPYKYILFKTTDASYSYIFQTENKTKIVAEIKTNKRFNGTYSAEIGFAEQKVVDGHTTYDVKPTGKGDAYRIFATIKSIVEDFFRTTNKDITRVEFSGKTTETSRIKLYDKIASNLGKFLPNFRLQAASSSGEEKVYYFDKVSNESVEEMLKRVKGKWALVSKSDPKKVLQYYRGPKDQRPSKEWVKDVERRVHSFESEIDEISKVRISTDPNDYGAYVSDFGKPEKTIMVPTNKIKAVLEPDDLHATKPGYADNMKRILSAIKAGKELPPILLRRVGVDQFQVLDGHHRFKAYKLAGKKSIPARIVDPKNVTGDKVHSFESAMMEGGHLLEDIESKIKNQFPNIDISIYGNNKRGYVLSQIVIPEKERNQGIGTKVMQYITDIADSEAAAVALTPDSTFGGSVGKLMDFYKRFGFVANKGRNKDFRFRETMIRYPR